MFFFCFLFLLIVKIYIFLRYEDETVEYIAAVKLTFVFSEDHLLLITKKGIKYCS